MLSDTNELTGTGGTQLCKDISALEEYPQYKKWSLNLTELSASLKKKTVGPLLEGMTTITKDNDDDDDDDDDECSSGAYKCVPPVDSGLFAGGGSLLQAVRDVGQTLRDELGSANILVLNSDAGQAHADVSVGGSRMVAAMVRSHIQDPVNSALRQCPATVPCDGALRHMCSAKELA